MFVFEDISTLDDLAIREILQRIDKKAISQALKGAKDATAESVLPEHVRAARSK